MKANYLLVNERCKDPSSVGARAINLLDSLLGDATHYAADHVRRVQVGRLNGALAAY